MAGLLNYSTVGVEPRQLKTPSRNLRSTHRRPRLHHPNVQSPANNKELSLLLGFLAKRPLELEYVPIREKAENQVIRASELLNELHVWCGIPTFDTSGKAGDNLQEQFDDFTQAYEEWMQSGRGMVEPIFYGSEGAHIFQYLEMASKR